MDTKHQIAACSPDPTLLKIMNNNNTKIIQPIPIRRLFVNKEGINIIVGQK
tara:strand:+ start:551 stop:703 length:153 start_codon:yes stop_codon:yes gene_type:complete